MSCSTVESELKPVWSVLDSAAPLPPTTSVATAPFPPGDATLPGFEPAASPGGVGLSAAMAAVIDQGAEGAVNE